MREEACKAAGLAARAIERKYQGAAVDSAWIQRHDFPTLGSSAVTSVYQIGSFLTGNSYVEVVVDRTRWIAAVQFKEGR